VIAFALVRHKKYINPVPVSFEGVPNDIAADAEILGSVPPPPGLHVVEYCSQVEFDGENFVRLGYEYEHEEAHWKEQAIDTEQFRLSLVGRSGPGAPRLLPREEFEESLSDNQGTIR
jgi:hypothetical protein